MYTFQNIYFLNKIKYKIYKTTYLVENFVPYIWRSTYYLYMCSLEYFSSASTSSKSSLLEHKGNLSHEKSRWLNNMSGCFSVHAKQIYVHLHTEILLASHHVEYAFWRTCTIIVKRISALSYNKCNAHPGGPLLLSHLIKWLITFIIPIFPLFSWVSEWMGGWSVQILIRSSLLTNFWAQCTIQGMKASPISTFVE